MEFIIAFLFFSFFSLAQESADGALDDDQFRLRSNVQTYTPSKLLKKGQTDVQMFNNLYTQTSFRDGERKLIDLNERSTYFTSFGQALFGTSKTATVNWGFDIIFKSVRIDADENSPSIKVLNFESSNLSRSAFSAIGTKIKFSPLKNHPDFSVQSAFWIPMAIDLEADGNDKPWLDWDRFTSWTQFFYSQQIGGKFQFFYELDLLARLSKPASWYLNNTLKANTLSTPASFFVNYFSNDKSTIYVMIQYWPNFQFNGGGALDSDFTQTGLGGKYQLTSNFAVELMYSNFLTSKKAGAGRTYNFGLRYIL